MHGAYSLPSRFVYTPPMQLRPAVFVVIAFALSVLGTQTRAAGSPRWQAGYQTIDVGKNADSRLEHIAVWYPTGEREQRFRTGPFAMQVAAKAPAAAGRFPVIGLSHGAFGHPINHRDLAIALARAGYIVVAPQHDVAADAAGFGDVRQREGRPAELLLALRTVRSHRAFASHFDAGRIGAIGYSAGGYAVLAAIHARSSWRDAVGHCLRHFISDRRFCFGGGGGQDRQPGTGRASIAATPRSVSSPTALRIRAAVLLAPVAAVFSTAGLTQVRAPVRIYSADNDEKLNSRLHGDWLYATLKAQGTPAERIRTQGGHYIFMSPFPDAIKTQVGAAAQDAPGFNRPAFQQRLARETIAFFTRTLPR